MAWLRENVIDQRAFRAEVWKALFNKIFQEKVAKVAADAYVLNANPTRSMDAASVLGFLRTGRDRPLNPHSENAWAALPASNRRQRRMRSNSISRR